MQASNAPSKSPVPFAESGSKNTIPIASQIGVTPGLASFTDGFPPLTMTPLAAGGIPPRGQDFNGILYFLSAASRWVQAGGSYSYDATFSAGIGGYPKGAILVASDGLGFWRSTADNNTTNPDSGGAGWVPALTNEATSAVPGVIKLATQAQTDAGTDDATAVTPKKLRFGFGISLGQNGYVTFPSWLGGLIIQWGRGVSNSAGVISQPLPIAFTSASYSRCICLGSNNITVAYGADSLNTITAQCFAAATGSTSVSTGYQFIIIGR